MNRHPPWRLFSYIANYIAKRLEYIIFQPSTYQPCSPAQDNIIKELERELSERKRSEKLQHALYKISSIHTHNADLSDFYAQIHEIIAELIYAESFFIALFDEDEQTITFPYFVDKKDNDIQHSTVTVGEGLTSYVIRTRKPQLLDVETVNQLIREGKVKEIFGSDTFVSWMGAPMIASNILYGVIVVQSYLPNVIYNNGDLQLMSFVSKHVANAIESTFITVQRQESQIKLAEQHRLLELKNNELNQLVVTLKSTQKELIQKEKMASLGSLVAGIAHEINTPLGICVTGVSHLEEEFKLVKNLMVTDELTEDALNSFFCDLEEILVILATNTKRGAELVSSFKQVAVDQSSNDLRTINVNQYIHEVILSLRPTLKRLPIEIKVVCKESLSIDINAGAISQILTNLILNSIKHGFGGEGRGKILIECYQKNTNTILKYADDGAGMDEEALVQLFEPFYTTKRGEGGSGLGTHLVYNLVTGALKGKLTAQSKPDRGLAYLIKFPINQV